MSIIVSFLIIMDYPTRDINMNTLYNGTGDDNADIPLSEHHPYSKRDKQCISQSKSVEHVNVTI